MRRFGFAVAARTMVVGFTFFCPGRVRSLVLRKLFGWSIHRTASIGLSIVDVKNLTLGPGAAIGHLNLIRNVELFELGETAKVQHLNVIRNVQIFEAENGAMIGNLNWIYGVPGPVEFFIGIRRSSSLTLGEHSALTSRHLVDCTDSVSIGRYSTVAGYRSQLLTHSVDIVRGKQDCHPISIGEYSFLGTGCIVLSGAKVPARSLIAAGSVVTVGLEEELTLYGGSPARAIRPLPADSRYFQRREGRVR